MFCDQRLKEQHLIQEAAKNLKQSDGDKDDDDGTDVDEVESVHFVEPLKSILTVEQKIRLAHELWKPNAPYPDDPREDAIQISFQRKLCLPKRVRAMAKMTIRRICRCWLSRNQSASGMSNGFSDARAPGDVPDGTPGFRDAPYIGDLKNPSGRSVPASGLRAHSR